MRGRCAGDARRRRGRFEQFSGRDRLSVQHMKQPAAGGAPEGSPCDFCNGTVSLTVTWDLGGGKTASDTLPAEKVSCAF